MQDDTTNRGSSLSDSVEVVAEKEKDAWSKEGGVDRRRGDGVGKWSEEDQNCRQEEEERQAGFGNSYHQEDGICQHSCGEDQEEIRREDRIDVDGESEGGERKDQVRRICQDEDGRKNDDGSRQDSASFNTNLTVGQQHEDDKKDGDVCRQDSASFHANSTIVHEQNKSRKHHVIDMVKYIERCNMKHLIHRFEDSSLKQIKIDGKKRNCVQILASQGNEQCNNTIKEKEEELTDKDRLNGSSEDDGNCDNSQTEGSQDKKNVDCSDSDWIDVDGAWSEMDDVAWTDDGMPFETDNVTIYMASEPGKGDECQFRSPCGMSLTKFVPKCCLPKQFLNDLKEEKRIMRRMDRIEACLSTISNRIERMAARNANANPNSNTCTKHSGSSRVSNQDQCDFDELSAMDINEDECPMEVEPKKKKNMKKGRLSAISSGLMDSLGSLCSEDMDMSKEMESCSTCCGSYDRASEEDLVSESNGTKSTCNSFKSKGDSDKTMTDSSRGCPSRSDRSKVKMRSTKICHVLSDDGSNLERKSTMLSCDLESVVETTLESTGVDSTSVNASKTLSSIEPKKVSYSDEYEPYLIKKPDAMPRSLQKKLAAIQESCLQ